MTRPCVGGVRPTMTRIVVVLPAPLGPRNPVTRPGWQTKLTSSTAVKAPYFRVSPSTLIMCPDCPNGPQPCIGKMSWSRPDQSRGGPRPVEPAPRPAVGLACCQMDRPAPEEYQPRLSAWGHTWRLVVMLRHQRDRVAARRRRTSPRCCSRSTSGSGSSRTSWSSSGDAGRSRSPWSSTCSRAGSGDRQWTRGPGHRLGGDPAAVARDGARSGRSASPAPSSSPSPSRAAQTTRSG